MAASQLHLFEQQVSLLGALLLAMRIAWMRNAVNISIKTQVLILLSNVMRHGDLLSSLTIAGLDRFLLKLAFIGLSIWTVYLLAQPSVK